MTALIAKQFSGQIPRLPESLLPENHASLAENCEFAYGELRGVKDGYLLRNMATSVGSLYTEDGLQFYTWASQDVDAVKSPLVNDTWQRIYYNTGTDVRVTTASGMTTSGGAPTSSYKVGVPRPTVAPALTGVTTINLNDYTLSARVHYEYSGVKYQEQALTSYTTIEAGKKWRFTAPAKAASTPEQAYVVVWIEATKPGTGEKVGGIYTSNSGLNGDTGYASLAIENISGTSDYFVTFSYVVPESDKETRAYVYTYVNTYNEEGPASPATVTTAVAGGQVTVTVTRDTLTDYAPLKEIRIYRTQNGTSVSEYFYVGAVSMIGTGPGTFTFIDKITASGLNEPLENEYAYPPPNNLKGLCNVGNGILAGFRGNEVWFCDGYKPWSWDPANVVSFPVAVNGILPQSAGALVTTVSGVYAVSGVSADGMTSTKLNTPHAGVHRKAMVQVDGAWVYASNDGLVVVRGGQASLAESQRFFTREVWRQRYGIALDTMRLAYWDGRLVAYSATNAFRAFMLSLDEAAGNMTELPNFTATCSFVLPLTDSMYYAQGSMVYQFAGSGELTAKWVSREMVSPMPINFGVAQAVYTGQWTVKIYAGGVLKHTESLAYAADTAVRVFRLPAGFRSDRWKVEIAGTGRFRELRVAVTAKELAKV